VGLAVAGLVAGLLSGPAGAATPRAAQGVSSDTIEVVVIVPDLDTLRAKGINVGNQSNADFVKRISASFDAYGPINGRTIDVKTVAWDPLDATSFDKACTQATQDNKPFVVINGSGYNIASIPCIAIDNKTPFISGDLAYGAMFKAAGKNLLTLGLPAEVAATDTAKLIAATKAIPKTAKIGILSNNRPEVRSASDTLADQLKKRGYDVASKVEVNGLAADAGVLGQGASAAADTFQAQGVDTVFNPQAWPAMQATLAEADKIGAKFKVYAFDGQANTCTPFSATRTPAVAVGATCVTVWDARTDPSKTKIKPDNALEAKCRKAFEKATGTATLPGGSSGPQTIGGVSYPGDLAPNECTIASFLLPAIKKAGKALTWDKVYANIMATTNGPAAFMSQGKGGFGKNKPYFANPTMHFEDMAGATADTAKDANGLYNGCAIPANCWIPKLVNGKEWFDLSSLKG
jgi:hypothetical protein